MNYSTLNFFFCFPPTWLWLAARFSFMLVMFFSSACSSDGNYAWSEIGYSYVEKACGRFFVVCIIYSVMNALLSALISSCNYLFIRLSVFEFYCCLCLNNDCWAPLCFLWTALKWLIWFLSYLLPVLPPFVFRYPILAYPYSNSGDLCFFDNPFMAAGELPY